MVVIDAPASGPTQRQRDFFSTLHNDLTALEQEAKAFIAAQDTAPAHLSKMRIYSVEIGQEENIASGHFVIELSDETADEIHRVSFKNQKPVSYNVDD